MGPRAQGLGFGQARVFPVNPRCRQNTPNRRASPPATLDDGQSRETAGLALAAPAPHQAAVSGDGSYFEHNQSAHKVRFPRHPPLIARTLDRPAAIPPAAKHAPAGRHSATGLDTAAGTGHSGQRALGPLAHLSTQLIKIHSSTAIRQRPARNPRRLVGRLHRCGRRAAPLTIAYRPLSLLRDSVFRRCTTHAPLGHSCDLEPATQLKAGRPAAPGLLRAVRGAVRRAPHPGSARHPVTAAEGCKRRDDCRRLEIRPGLLRTKARWWEPDQCGNQTTSTRGRTGTGKLPGWNSSAPPWTPCWRWVSRSAAPQRAAPTARSAYYPLSGSSPVLAARRHQRSKPHFRRDSCRRHRWRGRRFLSQGKARIEAPALHQVVQHGRVALGQSQDESGIREDHVKGRHIHSALHRTRWRSRDSSQSMRR